MGEKYQRFSFPASGKKDNAFEHLENVNSAEPVKPSKRTKARRHCKRFWFCYFIGGIIFLAIFLPLFFLKIIPAVAQAIVNNTELPIYNGSIKALSNDQVLIGLETALDVPAGLTVTLDGFELFLYNSDTQGAISPYTSVNLPEQSFNGHTVIQIANQIVNVGNRTELNKWLTKTVYNKTTDISVVADTTAHLGAIRAPIHLQKTVTIDALDKLDGVRLDSVRIVLPPEADGTNLIGNFTLPNWSPLTMGLGNLTFNAWAGDVIIGNATLLDVELPPGNSTRCFRGQIFIDVLVGNLGRIISSQAGAIASGNLLVGISGNSSTVAGEHITYLEDVLNNIRIDTQVPLIQALGDLLDSVSGDDPTLDLSGIVGLLGQFLGSDGPLSGLLDGLNLTQIFNSKDFVGPNEEKVKFLQASLMSLAEKE
ncbi:hypothetical protein BJ166DRAFT_600766 [Pestalotiopsis sp. NC0098]|nr:hypothetical protein BJ166DRAFT_600766 [Pestalotiopsis sp. NC0098]